MDSKKEKEAEGSSMLMEEPVKFAEPWMTREKLVVSVLIVIGLVLIIVGIVLLVSATKKNALCPSETVVPTTASRPTSPPVQARCLFSDEAERVGLSKFLELVKSTYYELHPFNIPYHPDVDTNPLKVRDEYEAYDPTPSAIKERTDRSYALLEQINTTAINVDGLSPRERKALAQVKHYLAHVFGQPYDVNYYAGDWMMGPNLFCWQPVCYHGHDIYNGIGLYYMPFNAEDVKIIESKLRGHKDGILQYIENMKMGIRKGMVRTKEECVAGLDSIKRKYLNVSLFNETGTFFVICCHSIALLYFGKQRITHPLTASYICGNDQAWN